MTEFLDNWSSEVLSRRKCTKLSEFAESGQSQWACPFISEEGDNCVWVKVRLVSSNGLSHQHLDYSDHAAPPDVLALGQLTVREPDDLFEAVEELLPRLVVVGVSEQIYALISLKL